MKRHPHIHYWFWTDATLQNERYLQTLERIAATSRFDLLTLTDRGCDFWDPSLKPHFAALVKRAHELDIRIVLQLWPRGAVDTTATSVTVDQAAAIALDMETTVVHGRAVLRSRDKWTRGGERAPAIDSEILCAYAFQKTADGYYQDGTLIDVSDRVQTVHRTPDRVSAVLDLPEYEGYTVFAVAAHYHRFADVFSDSIIRDYQMMMDLYADIPFDGIALDEFKGLPSAAAHTISEEFRGRMYGRCFETVFEQASGSSLRRTLLDMRYCPDGQDHIRAGAINLYFDIWRRGTTRVEDFVCEYSRKIFGADAFLGFHNTYHNDLTNDEIWNTGCNWWEVKRDYAQTDENMVFPVRMGLACQAKESLCYDMYYHTDADTFPAKCMNDAAFGSRIHYHAIDDGSRWGLDTGNHSFLQSIAIYEDNVALLNAFDPVLPAMSLLCVFGFPAQLNWYPDPDARAQFDVNAKLGILEKADTLWRMGYLNALAPDDAIIDGRITLDADGRFDYCGHRFDAMLFLYPEYSKPQTIEFLRQAVEQGARIQVIGSLTHGFDGLPTDGRFLEQVTLMATEGDAISLQQAAKQLCIPKNDIAYGCRLSDGSVVISHYASLRDGQPYTAHFLLDGDAYEVCMIGAFAIRTDGRGTIRTLVCGELRDLQKNGRPILPHVRGRMVCYESHT